MNKRLLILLFWILKITLVNGQYIKHVFYADKMGSPLTITIATKQGSSDSLFITKIANQAIQLIDSLNHIISDYDTTSEISVIHRNMGKDTLPISPILMEILLIAQKAYYQTKGAYNIAIGPLSVVWRKARQSRVLPTTQAIKSAQKNIRFENIYIDTLQHKIFLPKFMRLDFGSLGKGFIAQKALDYLKTKGLDYAMVDAGGKIVSMAPNKYFWRIGITQLREKNKTMQQTIHLSNQAVASSGDTYQFFIYKGHRYSHILNPFTGYGIETPKNVTVIAHDGVTADWLSTACSVLNTQQALQLAAKHHAAILIAIQKNKTFHYFQSKEFKAYTN